MSKKRDKKCIALCFTHRPNFLGIGVLCKICILAYQDIVCTIMSTAVAKEHAVCVLPCSGKQFKSLGVIGGTHGNAGNGSGCLAMRC